MHYPLLEQDGFCASITVEEAHGGRWRSSVVLERGADYARLNAHPKPLSVPNHFPSQAAAAEAAYAHARLLIAREAQAA